MEGNSQLVSCPGCGARLPGQNIEHAHGYNASGECYQKFNGLTYYTLGKQDLDFVHQHAVDAYDAQHSGNGMKNITTAFALIGLYLAIEQGCNGRQVQRMHTLLGAKKHPWERLKPLTNSYALTVCDVLNEAPGIDRDAMLRKWMCDVWGSWQHEHDWVKGTCRHSA